MDPSNDNEIPSAVHRMMDAFCKGELHSLNRLCEQEKAAGRELSITANNTLDMVPADGNIYFVTTQDCILKLGSEVVRSWRRRCVLDSGTVKDGSVAYNWAPIRPGAEDVLEEMLIALKVPFPVIDFI